MTISRRDFFRKWGAGIGAVVAAPVVAVVFRPSAGWGAYWRDLADAFYGAAPRKRVTDAVLMAASKCCDPPLMTATEVKMKRTANGFVLVDPHHTATEITATEIPGGR